TTNNDENSKADNEKTEGEATAEKSAEESAAKEKPEPTIEEKLADMTDKYLRKMAEFDNYRKRTMKEKAELILNGAERTVTAFLPIIDDMERAIENAAKSEDIDAVREGVNMIFQKFEKVLESLGVKKIATENADFNTDYHEAIAMVPGMGEDKKNKVIDCVQTGYTLNDKVIRHAKVAVGQ
ncbi:MAG: nucleotide exchange factor GrpE, partial [Bacteroidaceae bacterium]|nr:nucleotide exchange factor GrpE [Bacteroidaceae bacterium]